MIKRIFSVSLIVFILLSSFTACSGGQTETGAEDASQSVAGSYETEDTDTGDDSPKIVFETADLDGNTVRSEDIFSANDLTMINLWGTFCGPCINEMPNLETLSSRLKDKNCAVIGVVIDVPGAEYVSMVNTAKEIIADTGVTYLNVFPWENIDSEMPAQYVPTTYFVDSEGRLVGEAAIGARGADEYESLIDGLLAGM